MKQLLSTFTLSLLFFLATAQLSFVEELQDGGRDQANNLIDGLDRPYGLLVSPDNRYLYVAGIDDNALTVFERSLSTGILTHIETLKTNSTDKDGNTVQGLVGAINIAMTSDGEFIYVACLGNSLTVFQRDAVSGRLTFVENLVDGGTDQANNPITGLEEAVNIDVSTDDKTVYVTSRAFNGFTVFQRDPTTGILTFLEAMVDDGMDQAGNTLDGIRKPYGIKVTPDNQFVYVASTIEASVAVFSRSTTTGILTAVEVLTNGGRDQAGNLINGGLFGANNLTVSQDNRFLYVTAFSGDAVSVFSRNLQTGVLTFIETLSNGGTDGFGNNVTDLNGPQVILTTPTRAYVGAAVARSVVVFERNATTGRLRFLESQVNETNGINLLNDPEGLILSRDQRFVYASGDALNGLVVFENQEVLACPTTDTLTDQNLVSGIYEASLSITARGNTTVATNEIVEFRAGSQINLRPSFSVASGANFTASISDCAANAVTVENRKAVNTEIDPFTPIQLEIAPNPLSSETTISYHLPHPSSVTLGIYDLQGKIVRQLFWQENQSGKQVFTFDATSLENGMYWISLQTDDEISTQRVSILR